MVIRFMILLCLSGRTVLGANAGDSVTVKTTKLRGTLFMLSCENGFGGGNMVACAGNDGVLLVDDMYAMMSNQLKASIAAITPLPIRIIINTHFHNDHIQGNRNFKPDAAIIGQRNIAKRLIEKNTKEKPTLDLMPSILFDDSLTANFNSEEIKITHYRMRTPIAMQFVYFPKSNVLHLGDMFFNGMFPAVYAEGGGNIHLLIAALEDICRIYPPDAIVIPGHGNAASMKDLIEYTEMLKETVSLVEEALRRGSSADEMKNQKLLIKYDKLGSGGAQSTDQYLAMLIKLLKK